MRERYEIIIILVVLVVVVLTWIILGFLLIQHIRRHRPVQTTVGGQPVRWGPLANRLSRDDQAKRRPSNIGEMTAEPNLVPGNNGDEIQQQQPAVIPSSNYDTITSRHDIIMQMPEAPGGAINIEREHEISTPRRVAQPPSSPIRTTDQANPPPRYEELVT